MPSSPIPHDVLSLIKDQIDPTLIGPHLLLSNVSESFRANLYPKGDESWKTILTSMGIGRSRNDLEGKPIKKSRSWREIAVEVSRHEKEGSCLVAGDVYADEGREMMCSMTRANNYRVTKHPVRVTSVEEVQKEKILVLAHPQLGEDFDCHQPGSNILRYGPWRDDEKDEEKDLLVRYHPVRCHSFATVPPVQALSIDAFDLTVFNEEGVTQWDVRVAMFKKYKKRTGKYFKQDAEDTYHSLGDNFDKKTKVKLSDFLIIGERVFNGVLFAERGSCIFEIGTDSWTSLLRLSRLLAP